MRIHRTAIFVTYRSEDGADRKFLLKLRNVPYRFLSVRPSGDTDTLCVSSFLFGNREFVLPKGVGDAILADLLVNKASDAWKAAPVALSAAVAAALVTFTVTLPGVTPDTKNYCSIDPDMFAEYRREVAAGVYGEFDVAVDGKGAGSTKAADPLPKRKTFPREIDEQVLFRGAEREQGSLEDFGLSMAAPDES